MSLNIIINADDLGKNHVVNSAIAEALSLHVISSSTIMANSSTWEEVHSIIDNNPKASFGVHLNLTEGKALTNSEIFHRMNVVDANNCFTKEIRKIKHPSKELLEAVYHEWDEQINKVLNVEGIKVSHIDGHHHIHGDYVYRKIVVRLCEKYGIYKIRNRYTSPSCGIRSAINALFMVLSIVPGMLCVANHMRCFGKAFAYMYGVMERFCWQREMNRVVCMTDYFDAYASICEKLNAGALYPVDCTIELMCHPGHLNYLKEYEMIKADVVRNYINIYKLINYKDLKR